MNKLLLSILFILTFSASLVAQTKVTGTVKRSDTEKTVYDVTVTLIELGESVSTDRIGYFQFLDVPEGNYTLRIEGQGYEDYQQQITVGNEKLELADIVITYNPTDVNIGVITLSNDELSDDESSAQASIGLLQASRDIFAQTAAFEFGSYWFRIRGYENKYSDVLFNGVRMNKIDNDRVDFGNWGGLNDITRYPDEVTLGIDPSDYAFGDAGGVTAINPRPSNLRKGVSLAYSLTNRSYRQRVLASYNTGLSEKGWAFSFSGARRWAEEGLIEGTLYDASAYFAAIEKKFNEHHSLVLSGFGAPYRRTSNSPNTQEVIDLRGIGYNAYWGWQDGEKRNERIRRNFEPVFQLVHYWTINEKSRLNTTLSYQFGTNGSTRLDWYNANNPSPIFWRNMPSAYRFNGNSQEDIDAVINRWQTDPTWSQIDWQDLYNQNANANTQGLAAPYALVDDKNDDKVYSFHTNFRTELTDDITLTTIANYQYTNSELYRELDDLLGGNFAANNDDFDNFEFDLNNPNRQVREGERYQYDYEFNRHVADIYVRSDIALGKFDLTLGARASYTSANRDGHYLNEIYQENSFGKSPNYEFWNFGIKGNLVYKIDGRNFIQANGAYFTTAPTMQEIFPNARVNSSTLPDLESAKTTSTDLSFIHRSPRFKARATGYYTLFEDEIESNFAFIDRGVDGDGSVDDFGALVTTGVDKQHIGAEVALDFKITSSLRAYGVASISQFTYNDNANQYVLFAGETEFGAANIVGPGIDDRGTAYIRDYKVAEGPQQAYSIGLEYRSPKYWWVGVSGNFLADNYVAIANIKRTEDFVTDFSNPDNPVPIINPDTGVQLTEEDVRPFLEQEKFSDEFMLNFNAGKTFRLGDYYAGISLNINNVLNNEDYVTGGFEQARVANYNIASDENLSTAFGNRYWYNQGTTYFLNLFLRF